MSSDDQLKRLEDLLAEINAYEGDEEGDPEEELDLARETILEAGSKGSEAENKDPLGKEEIIEAGKASEDASSSLADEVDNLRLQNKEIETAKAGETVDTSAPRKENVQSDSGATEEVSKGNGNETEMTGSVPEEVELEASPNTDTPIASPLLNEKDPNEPVAHTKHKKKKKKSKKSKGKKAVSPPVAAIVDEPPVSSSKQAGSEVTNSETTSIPRENPSQEIEAMEPSKGDEHASEPTPIDGAVTQPINETKSHESDYKVPAKVSRAKDSVSSDISTDKPEPRPEEKSGEIDSTRDTAKEDGDTDVPSPLKKDKVNPLQQLDTLLDEHKECEESSGLLPDSDHEDSTQVNEEAEAEKLAEPEHGSHLEISSKNTGDETLITATQTNDGVDSKAELASAVSAEPAARLQDNAEKEVNTEDLDEAQPGATASRSSGPELLSAELESDGAEDSHTKEPLDKAEEPGEAGPVVEEKDEAAEEAADSASAGKQGTTDEMAVEPSQQVEQKVDDMREEILKVETPDDVPIAQEKAVIEDNHGTKEDTTAKDPEEPSTESVDTEEPKTEEGTSSSAATDKEPSMSAKAASSAEAKDENSPSQLSSSVVPAEEAELAENPETLPVEEPAETDSKDVATTSADPAEEAEESPVDAAPKDLTHTSKEDDAQPANSREPAVGIDSSEYVPEDEKLLKDTGEDGKSVHPEEPNFEQAADQSSELASENKEAAEQVSAPSDRVDEEKPEAELDTNKSEVQPKTESVEKIANAAVEPAPAAAPETKREPVDESNTVYLYMSLASGVRGSMGRYNRATTILDSYQIKYVPVEITLDERALRLWKLKGVSKNKTLPAVFRDGDMKCDYNELLEANEMEEVEDLIFDGL